MTRPEFVTPEHHAVEIVWDSDVPVEMRAMFRPYAEWLARFAPRWVQTLYVAVRDDNAGAALHVSVNMDYNRVTLSVYMGWLSQKRPERAEDVAHELVHLYTAPIDTAVVQMRSSEPPELAKLHTMLYRKGDESATVSLARLLVAHLPPVELQPLAPATSNS